MSCRDRRVNQIDEIESVEVKSSTRMPSKMPRSPKRHHEIDKYPQKAKSETPEGVERRECGRNRLNGWVYGLLVI
jgi:hypothetical protein